MSYYWKGYESSKYTCYFSAYLQPIDIYSQSSNLMIDEAEIF